MVKSNGTKKIILPDLPDADIDKLDKLLSFMKENEKEFVDIYKVCKKKWGDNKLLYLFFAEYLKKNSFSLVQNYNKGQEYVWKQRILPRGLALNSFKKEQARQHNKKREGTPHRLRSSLTGISRSVFFIATFIVSFLCSSYHFSNDEESKTINMQQEPLVGIISEGKKIVESRNMFSVNIKQHFHQINLSRLTLLVKKKLLLV